MLALFQPTLIPSAREVQIASDLGINVFNMEETRAARDQLIELRKRAVHEIERMQDEPEHHAQVCLFDSFDGGEYHDRFHPEAILSFEAEMLALGYTVESEAGSVFIYFSLPRS